METEEETLFWAAVLVTGALTKPSYFSAHTLRAPIFSKPNFRPAHMLSLFQGHAPERESDRLAAERAPASV